MSGFAVYKAVKELTLTAVLLVLGITTRSTINKLYTASKCDDCFERSKGHADTGYEFTVCHSTYTPAITGHNLMTAGFHPGASPVDAFLPELITLAIIHFFFALFAFCGRRYAESWFNNTRVLGENLISNIIWMWFGNQIFMMTLKNGCYVASWPLDFIRIQWYAGAFVLGLIVLEYIIGAAWRWYYVEDFKYFAYVNWPVLIASFALTVFLAITNFRFSGNFFHLIFAGIILLSVLDGIIWRFCCGPTGKTEETAGKPAGDYAKMEHNP